MAAAFSLGSFALDQMGNVAQLGQSYAHQRESIAWQRRSYKLDSQSVRLDALDHAKEEIKSHYDTYVGRIDTLLLVLALIFPFALNVIQFSDPFVPSTPEECPDCIETEYSWLVTLWGCMIGIVLILPFWGIMMMIRCKLGLDRWLEYSLSGLHQKRREIVAKSYAAPEVEDTKSKLERDEETEQIVFTLVNEVLRNQELLGKKWTSEWGRLFQASTVLLWLSAVSALLLTALSMWLYLVNKGGEHTVAGCYFAGIITIGCLLPVLYLAWHSTREEAAGSEGTTERDLMAQDDFPLARRASVSFLSRPISPFGRSTSPFNLPEVSSFNVPGLNGSTPSGRGLSCGSRGLLGRLCARRWHDQERPSNLDDVNTPPMQSSLAAVLPPARRLEESLLATNGHGPAG